MPPIKIVPSILAADRKRINEEIKIIEPYADSIQIDVMDGKFVPPIEFLIAETRKIKTTLQMEAHLMVQNPEKDWIEDYINAGCSKIIIHVESTKNIKGALSKIKFLGAKPALAVNPPTPIETVFPYLKELDMVLVMSVNPGWTGQKFIPDVLQKIKSLRKLNKNIDIEVDGGINTETVKLCVEAGANVIVAASAIFGKEDKIKAIKELRNIAEEAKK